MISSRSDRPKVLLAPVTVTPTKPLTPSHLKGLLWVDVMFKATSLLTDVDYRYSHTTYDVTAQTLGFWAYLDHRHAGLDFSGLTEEEIGELYVDYQSGQERWPYSVLREYEQAVEDTGWVHPASERLLDVWSGHYRLLGLHDPGLRLVQPPGLGLDELVERLAERNLCLDLRAAGGPVYLDATAHGLPLRQIVTAEGQPNYLACALRELVPLAGRHDEVVLLCDHELAEDYLLLQRVLENFGQSVCRVPIHRVPIEGSVKSSRHGGWRGYTMTALAASALVDYSPAAVRLGVRLYFIAMLGKGTGQSFRADLLRGALKRADKLLSECGRATLGDVDRFVRSHTGSSVHVDPYRLTSALLVKHRPAPVRELTSLVYG